jgi:DNA-binding response OmpR family regulator
VSVILVIDDDEAVRAVVERILEKEGHRVTGAADGERGVAAFRAIKPDLVITDIIMPEKEGIWTIRQIRGDGAATPILAMSGGGSIVTEDVLHIARRLGANETIAKPFSAAELIEKVRALLVP